MKEKYEKKRDEEEIDIKMKKISNVTRKLNKTMGWKKFEEVK